MTEPCGRRQMIVAVRAGHPSSGILRCGPWAFACALGRRGVGHFKREGDGRTPAGSFALRRVLYRPDRIARPRTGLPVAPIRPSDGWCDEPSDRNYNRAVTHPYPSSAERLWREDALYDLVVVVGHNERPRLRGGGSAIFVHVVRPGLQPTEGCVAVSLRPLLCLISRLRIGDRILIAPAAGGRPARAALGGRHAPPMKKARSLLRARAR